VSQDGSGIERHKTDKAWSSRLHSLPDVDVHRRINRLEFIHQGAVHGAKMFPTASRPSAPATRRHRDDRVNRLPVRATDLSPDSSVKPPQSFGRAANGVRVGGLTLGGKREVKIDAGFKSEHFLDHRAQTPVGRARVVVIRTQGTLPEVRSNSAHGAPARKKGRVPRFAQRRRHTDNAASTLETRSNQWMSAV